MPAIEKIPARKRWRGNIGNIGQERRRQRNFRAASLSPKPDQVVEIDSILAKHEKNLAGILSLIADLDEQRKLLVKERDKLGAQINRRRKWLAKQ